MQRESQLQIRSVIVVNFLSRQCESFYSKVLSFEYTIVVLERIFWTI